MLGQRESMTRRAASRWAALAAGGLILLAGCGRPLSPAEGASGTGGETPTTAAVAESMLRAGSADGGGSAASTPVTSEAEEPAALDPGEATDGLDAAPDAIRVNGADYRRLDAVAWFDVYLRGEQIAVTTGPEVRGACDTSIFRLAMGKEAGEPVTVTSYEYAPVTPPGEGDCPAIGLPPAVATFLWPQGFSDVTEIRDGVTGTLHPVRKVLLPPVLPAGFTADAFSAEWPQVTDDTRPQPFGPGGSWSGSSGSLMLVEYSPDHVIGLPVLGHVDVRGTTAEVTSGLMMTGDRCLRWTDAVTEETVLCSTGAGGHGPFEVEALADLADSLAF